MAALDLVTLSTRGSRRMGRRQRRLFDQTLGDLQSQCAGDNRAGRLRSRVDI